MDALDDLRKRGFTNDFNLKENCVECAGLELELQPDDFEIVEVHRFEGATNPDDSSVLYAIEGKDTAAALGLSELVSGEYLLAQKEHLARRKMSLGDSFIAAMFLTLLFQNLLSKKPSHTAHFQPVNPFRQIAHRYRQVAISRQGTNDLTIEIEQAKVGFCLIVGRKTHL